MKIEKGIPIPGAGEQGQWDFLYDMEVGDSFLLDAGQPVSESATRSAIVSHTNKTGALFMSRGWPGGIRFWRIE